MDPHIVNVDENSMDVDISATPDNIEPPDIIAPPDEYNTNPESLTINTFLVYPEDSTQSPIEFETRSNNPEIVAFARRNPRSHGNASTSRAVEDRSPSPDLLAVVTKRKLADPAPDNQTVSVPNTSENTENKCAKCNCDNQTTKKRLGSDEDEDEGKLCPICFDIWSNSGEHRLCALRCGHLFGHSCLLRWFSGQKTCPTCKSTVRKTDIRFIYAKKLIALDTSELDAVRMELDKEKCDKNRVQLELMQCKQREELQKKEIKSLKTQVELLKRSTRPVTSSQMQFPVADTKMYKERSVDISRDGGCRVMDYYNNSNLLVVSASSPNPLFAGYGIRKVTVRDYRNTVFIPLHSNVIRDLSFHPQRELLLSVSVDKYARLTETANNKPIFSVGGRGPLWSCCWDASNPNHFYVGEQLGSVVKYDMRMPNDTLSILQVQGDMSPVVSVASAGWCPGEALPQGGILACKLNSCWAFVEKPDGGEANRFPLSLEGPFVSLRYNNVSKHLLVSARPNPRQAYARHTVCTLSKDPAGGDAISCDLVHTFQGSPMQKLLSRSCLMNLAGDVLVAAHQEANKVVDVWSVSNGTKLNSLPAHTAVLDLCPVSSDASNYLCALNEKKVEFFKIDFV